MSTRTAAVVLLSGGMDSTVALFWARNRFQSGSIRALFIHYGQPQSDAERVPAQRAASAAEIPFVQQWCSDAFGKGGITDRVIDATTDTTGSMAVVPNRNAVLIASAVSHGLSWFPGVESLSIVMGAVAEDAAGFPDCRRDFFVALSSALSLANGLDIQIETPWIRHEKRHVLEVARQLGCLDIARSSWSCYRGLHSGPCGACHACETRSAAMVAAGVTDLSQSPALCGGDPSRERR